MIHYVIYWIVVEKCKNMNIQKKVYYFFINPWIEKNLMQKKNVAEKTKEKKM